MCTALVRYIGVDSDYYVGTSDAAEGRRADTRGRFEYHSRENCAGYSEGYRTGYMAGHEDGRHVQSARYVSCQPVCVVI